MMPRVRSRGTSPLRRLAGTLLACALLAPAAEANADSPARTRDPAISAGRLAILVRHATRPEDIETLQHALSDDRPEVRAAAARVIHASGAKLPAETLREALSTEVDPVAAREEADALVYAEGALAVGAILEAGGRLGGGMPGVMAMIAARVIDDAGLAEYVSTVLELPISPRRRASCILMASGYDAERLGRAGAVVLDAGEADTWLALVSVAAEDRVDPGTPLFVSALRNPSTAIAVGTAWQLAPRLVLEPPADKTVLLAALEAAESLARGGDPDDLLGFELLARALGREPRESVPWIERLGMADRIRLDLINPARSLLSLLTRKEYRALRKRERKLFPDRRLPQPLTEKEKAVQSAALHRPDDFLHVQTASGFPPGLVRDTLEARGCQLSERPLLAETKIKYDRLGRPTNLILWLMPEDPSCREAMTDLFALSVAPSGRVPDPSVYEMLILVLRPETLAAFEEEPPAWEAGAVAWDSREPVKPPTRIRFVKPDYPESERQRHATARVIMEIVVDEDGLVRDMRLLQGAPDAFVVSAFRATSQWRYRPASRDGRPVRVYLTVIVEYALR